MAVIKNKEGTSKTKMKFMSYFSYKKIISYFYSIYTYTYIDCFIYILDVFISEYVNV